MVMSEKDKDGKRPVTYEDLWGLKFVSDPEISPDGSKIVWVEGSTNVDENTYESSIWMVSKESGGNFGDPVRLTYATVNGKRGAREGSPRFSPDGRYLAFSSNRSGGGHIWLLDLREGGEARQITEGDQGASGITWLPDGKHIAFMSSVPEDKGDKPDDEEKAKRNRDVTVVKHLRYKMNGAPYVVTPRVRHIFTVDIETKEKKQITEGEYSCSAPAFSPDGKTLAFLSYREPGEMDVTQDIWIRDFEGGELKRLTKGEGFVGQPVYSPDGKYLAFFGNVRKDVAAAKSEILVVPVNGGDLRVLTESFDRNIGCSVGSDSRMGGGRSGPWWSPDGKFIYFTATDRGYSKIYRVSLDNSKVCEIGGAEADFPPVITSMVYRNVGGRDTFAFVGGSATNPGDLYTGTGFADGPVPVPAPERRVTYWRYQVAKQKMVLDNWLRLTSVNEELLSGLKLSEPELFSFTAPDGVELEGWFMKPVDFDPWKKYPSVLEIHGGPAATYGFGFFHEFQLLTSNGYGVFFCNPRGSLGYGEWFAQQVIGDQGGMDYQDIMALRAYMDGIQWVDSNKVGVTGGSYGGYMTNWIVGHTDKFKAAVTQRSISNWYTKLGTSDIGWSGNRKGLGMRDLWDSEDFLMERSPIRYAPRVNTPILIIHSELDYRCPMEQAEQWYIALKRLGKTVEFVRFAGENHELSRSGKPRNRKERLYHILRWFDEHLK